MAFWTPRSIQQLVFASIFAALAPLFVAVLFTVQTLGEVDDYTRRITHSVLDATRTGSEIQQGLLDVERLTRQYFALFDPHLVELLEHELSTLEDLLRRLQVTLPSQSPDIAALSDKLHALRLLAASDRDDARTLRMVDHFFTVLSGVGLNVQRWLQASIEEMTWRSAAQRDTLIDSLIIQITMMAMVTVILLSLLAWWIVRPVKQLVQEIHQLGTAGLSHKIEISGPKEVQALSTKLDWLRQNLHETDQHKRQFLRHVSHELKTPLSCLREGTELLSDGILGKLSQPQQEMVGYLRDNSIELQRLIENLLDYNQLSGQRLIYVRMDIQPILEELLKKYKIFLEKRGLDLNMHGEIDKWIADSNTLRTAMDNILSNAIHYTPENGKIQIDWYSRNDELIIDVANTGEPIPQIEADQLFLPFTKGKTRRRGPIQGTGLGLSVARECIEAQGGSLSLVPHDTLPICFRIICPAHRSSH